MQTVKDRNSELPELGAKPNVRNTCFGRKDEECLERKKVRGCLRWNMDLLRKYQNNRMKHQEKNIFFRKKKTYGPQLVKVCRTNCVGVFIFHTFVVIVNLS